MRVIAAILSACALMIANADMSRADAIADFYHGRQISLYVAFPPGGGYDIYARLILPHFQRHIPGNPQIVIKNMEGGSGVRAASYMTSVTPRDGLSLGLFLDALTLGKVMGGPGDFDPVKLNWIGRMTTTATLAVVWHTARARSVEEAKTTEIIIASTVASNSSSFIPLALNDLAGTKFRLIAGYQGSPPMALAMERGEVDAIAGMSWEAIQTVKPDWLRENKVRFLYTLGARRLRDLPETPCLPDFAVDDGSRGILGLLGSGQDIGRSLVAEPGTPVERIAALRRAFDETMADPAWIADATTHNLSVDAASGEEVTRIVASVAGTPREIIDASRKYFGQ